MKKKITYAVNDVLEWECCISVLKANIRLNFSGGGISPYGQTAAEFTTSNTMLQGIIESSSYYKSGRIYILRSERLDDTGNVDPGDQIPKMSECETTPSTPSTPEYPSGAKCEGDGIVYIQVSDINEAKEYLVSKFGLKPSSLKTRDNINKAASENKICFEYEQ